MEEREKAQAETDDFETRRAKRREERERRRREEEEQKNQEERQGPERNQEESSQPDEQKPPEEDDFEARRAKRREERRKREEERKQREEEEREEQKRKEERIKQEEDEKRRQEESERQMQEEERQRQEEEEERLHLEEELKRRVAAEMEATEDHGDEPEEHHEEAREEQGHGWADREHVKPDPDEDERQHEVLTLHNAVSTNMKTCWQELSIFGCLIPAFLVHVTAPLASSCVCASQAEEDNSVSIEDEIEQRRLRRQQEREERQREREERKRREEELRAEREERRRAEDEAAREARDAARKQRVRGSVHSNPLHSRSRVRVGGTGRGLSPCQPFDAHCQKSGVGAVRGSQHFKIFTCEKEINFAPKFWGERNARDILWSWFWRVFLFYFHLVLHDRSAFWFRPKVTGRCLMCCVLFLFISAWCVRCSWRLGTCRNTTMRWGRTRTTTRYSTTTTTTRTMTTTTRYVLFWEKRRGENLGSAIFLLLSGPKGLTRLLNVIVLLACQPFTLRAKRIPSREIEW